MADLTVELEQARRIAVALENENAELRALVNEQADLLHQAIADRAMAADDQDDDYRDAGALTTGDAA